MNINEIVSGFQIIGHSIKTLHLENGFIFFDPNDDTVQREVYVSYDMSEPFDADDGDSIGGALTLYIDTKTSNEENSTEIHLELEGGFILAGSKDADKLKEMMAVNGCAALYSIGRGIISGITSQMSVDGTGTIMLPMINTFELRNDQEGEH